MAALTIPNPAECTPDGAEIYLVAATFEAQERPLTAEEQDAFQGCCMLLMAVALVRAGTEPDEAMNFLERLIGQEAGRFEVKISSNGNDDFDLNVAWVADEQGSDG